MALPTKHHYALEMYVTTDVHQVNMYMYKELENAPANHILSLFSHSLIVGGIIGTMFQDNIHEFILIMADLIYVDIE